MLFLQVEHYTFVAWKQSQQKYGYNYGKYCTVVNNFTNTVHLF
jgi:hypothetical protein